VWADDLKMIRRFLRDPDGNIWDEPYLRHTWNDLQKDMQNRTGVLEDVVAQRVPDLYHCAYMFDWEWRHLPENYSEFYQCLRKHDEGVFCHAWEPQEVTGISSDTQEDGAHFTQPFEAFMGLVPGEEVRMKFPKNLKSLTYIAYDEEPILETTRKMVQGTDSSYVTRTGRPIAYFSYESLDKTYVLYPTPSTAFSDDVAGDGVAFYTSEDSEDTSVGTIAVRTGSSESGNVGASVDIVGLANNVLLIYDVNPTNIETVSDESDFPEFLRKYVRYGVISRAYAANTDGRIPSLAALWASRYEFGVKIVKRLMLRRANDRDYRLATKPSAVTRGRRTPRLPSTYPAV
jgi:hypothetical protein